MLKLDCVDEHVGEHVAGDDVVDDDLHLLNQSSDNGNKYIKKGYPWLQDMSHNPQL